MQIDTIVTDMDDTLFSLEDGLNDYTIRVVHECVKRGIRFIPASGRTHASMYPHMLKLNTNQPYIAGNGAEIVNADHSVMSTLFLDAQTAREICAFLAQNGFYVQVYRDNCFYYAEECDPALRYKKSSGMKGFAVGDLSKAIDFDTPKVLSVNHPQEVERLYPIINKRFEGRATFTTSKAYFLEGEPIGATKGNALRRLADIIGIDPEHTAVFGDSLNDISMLAFTPHSVAMGNARDEVKKAAAYVCGPNTEDGLAKFIEAHILNA